MKITINRKALHDALNTVGRVIKSATTLPILGHISLRTSGTDHIEMVATNLDLYVRTEAEASIQHPGKTTVLASKFRAIVAALSGDEVELVMTDGSNTLEINCGSSQFKLFGLAYDEFPHMPALPKENTRFSIEQPRLKTILAQTTFAASTDPSRFILLGNMFELKKGKLITAATDGRRLALAETDFKSIGEIPDTTVVVPSNTTGELLRLLADAPESGDEPPEVCVNLTADMIRFTFGATILHSKLIEGNYPPVRSVIPPAEGPALSLNRVELVAALNRITNIQQESCTLDFEKNVLRLHADKTDVGVVDEQIAIPRVSRPLKIIFNPCYLLEGLNALTTEEVYMWYEDSLTPALFRSPDGPQWLYVAMPMRSGEEEKKEKEGVTGVPPVPGEGEKKSAAEKTEKEPKKKAA